MASLQQFREHDFYTDSEADEDFSKYLSDDENSEENSEDETDVNMNLEKTEIIEVPEDFVLPSEPSKKRDEGVSLLDSLLGEALSGEQVNEPIPGLFDDLSDDEAEIISRNQLEVDDSGISSQSVSHETDKSIEIESKIEKLKEQVEKVGKEEKNAFEMSSIDKYLQYVNEEEHAVSVDEIPDFASKKNVYGTSFNVRTGNISRPPRFEFARRDDRWIDSCKILTYEKEKPLNELMTLGKQMTSVKKGMMIGNHFKYTDIHYKSAKEMAEMETLHIQQIIRDAFNAKRLAVILFGVEKDGKITGCPLNPGKQDNLRLALDTAVQTEFVPPIENILDAIDVQFIPIEDNDNTFLIVIRIKQLRNQIYRLESSV